MATGLAAAGLVGGAWAWTLPVAPIRTALPTWSWGSFLIAGCGSAVLSVPVVGQKLNERDEGQWAHQGIVVAIPLVAGVGTAYSWWQVKVDVDGGLPRQAMPLMATALLLLMVGGIARTCSAGSPGGGRRRNGPVGWRGRLVAVGVMVVVALAATALSVGLARSVANVGVDATTAAPGDPLRPPTAPERTAWSRSFPGGHDIGDLGDTQPAAGGLAMAVDGSLVLIDGATGRERWRHRRPGAALQDMWVNRTGTWVVAKFVPRHPHDGGGAWYVVLDAATGQVAWDLVQEPSPDERTSDIVLGVTDHVVVMLAPDGRDRAPVVAIDLATGERLWTLRRSVDCDLQWFDPTESAMAQDTIVMWSDCSGRYEIVGVDDRTGDERWRYEPVVPEHTDRGGLDMWMSQRGDTMYVDAGWVRVRQGEEEREQAQVILDTSSGEVHVSEEAMASRPARPAGTPPSEPGENSDGAFSLDQPTVSGTVRWAWAVDATDEGESDVPDLFFHVTQTGGEVTEAQVPDCGDTYSTFADDDHALSGLAVVDQALVVACSGATYDTPNPDQQPFVWVAPLDDPAAARRIDVEPETPQVSNGEPLLIVAPGLIAVAWEYGNRITALA